MAVRTDYAGLVGIVDLLRSQFDWNLAGRDTGELANSYSVAIRAFDAPDELILSCFCDYVVERRGSQAAANFRFSATYYISLDLDIQERDKANSEEIFRTLAATIGWAKFSDLALLCLSQARIEDVPLLPTPREMTYQQIRRPKS